MRTLDETKHAQRLDLFNQGLTDPEIAAATGVHKTSVLRWRRAHGLGTALPRGRTTRHDTTAAILTPDLKRRCLALLERGVGASLIARETGVSVKSLDRWRGDMLRDRPELRRPCTTRKSIPRYASGRPYSRMGQPRRGQAFLLYADGLPDTAIAEELGVSRARLTEWRLALHLPPNRPPSRAIDKPARRTHRAITPLSNPTHAAIFASLAKWAAPDLRDDMASEMWLALLEGRMSANQIPAQAGRICNQVARDFADRFGPRSLDEDISDGEGFKLLDLIRDDRSSSWLEEMGATAW